jgi:hypothetical protein
MNFLVEMHPEIPTVLKIQAANRLSGLFKPHLKLHEIYETVACLGHVAVSSNQPSRGRRNESNSV